jgi:hypothetical protein
MAIDLIGVNSKLTSQLHSPQQRCLQTHDRLLHTLIMVFWIMTSCNDVVAWPSETSLSYHITP